MDKVLKEYVELNDSIYNIRLDIGYTSQNNISLNINHNINTFTKLEQKISKFCKKYNNKIYTTYHHNNLILYIENDINYVYENTIDKLNMIPNIIITKYSHTILDNIVFPNLENFLYSFL